MTSQLGSRWISGSLVLPKPLAEGRGEVDAILTEQPIGVSHPLLQKQHMWMRCKE